MARPTALLLSPVADILTSLEPQDDGHLERGAPHPGRPCCPKPGRGNLAFTTQSGLSAADRPAHARHSSPCWRVLLEPTALFSRLPPSPLYDITTPHPRAHFLLLLGNRHRADHRAGSSTAPPGKDQDEGSQSQGEHRGQAEAQHHRGVRGCGPLRPRITSLSQEDQRPHGDLCFFGH